MRILTSLLIAFAVVSLSFAQEHNPDKVFSKTFVVSEPGADEIAKAKSGNQGSVAALEAVKEGNYFWRWGSMKLSSASYQRAVDLDPSLYSAQFNLGLTLLERRQFDKAILSFAEAVRLQPDSPNAWQNLGFAQYYGKQYQKSVEAFLQAQRLAPTDAVTSNNLGFAYIFAGRFAEAVDSFQTALRLNPKLTPAMNGLCSAQALAEQPSVAFEACGNAAASDTQSSVAHYFLGYGHLDRGEIEQGMSAFQKALRIEPDAAKIYVGLGFAYLQLKQFRSALRQFDYARKLDPNVQYALLGLGSTYAQMKDYVSAEVALQGAVALEPNNPAARFNLAIVCLARKNRDCALSQYNRLKMTDSPLAKFLFATLFEGRVVYVSDARK